MFPLTFSPSEFYRNWKDTNNHVCPSQLLHTVFGQGAEHSVPVKFICFAFMASVETIYINSCNGDASIW